MVVPPGPRLLSKPPTAHAFGMTKLDRLAVRVGDSPAGEQLNTEPGVCHAHFRAGIDGEDTPACFHRRVCPLPLVEVGDVDRIDITFARLEPIAVAEPSA